MSLDLRDSPIGVFDSGLGGASVLQQMIRIMPEEEFMYYGDSLNAPYGTKSIEEVRELTIIRVEHLLKRHAKGIVVACNTATSAAVSELRKRYPDVPLVGIEPAIKPAALQHPGGRIVVMATPMTLRQEKFRNLVKQYEDEANFVPLPCPGLMEFVERGETNSDKLRRYLTELFWSVQDEPIDAIVLGCTHYPFVREMISEVAGEDIAIYDGALGTAKEMQRRLREANLLTTRVIPGRVAFQSSAHLKGEEMRFHKLLAL